MSTIDTLDTTDAPWIGRVIDIIEQAIGLPWRVALDEIDLAPHAPHRLQAVTAALRRAGGSRSRNTPLARRARALTLGPPVLADADRSARITTAAASLGIAEHELEAALWADLPGERAIELPAGRPHELAIAAAANVLLVQRALRRAQLVRLRMWPTGDGTLLRAALSRGLLVTASHGDAGETMLEIVGPLALFHRTSVYARALGHLVPLLAACERFELELECETGTSAYRSRLASPVLLPLEHVAYVSPVVARLARDLVRAAPGLDVDVAPLPLAVRARGELVCPDLVIAGRWHVELVGFWTRAHLDAKLARYRDAGITDVILCVDEARACANDEAPHHEHFVGYDHRVSAARVLDIVNRPTYRSRDA